MLTHMGSDNNLYTTTEGGSTADVKALSVGDYLGLTSMGNRAVIDTTNYKLYATESQAITNSRFGNNSGYVTIPQNIPMGFYRWVYYRNNTLTPLNEDTNLTQEFAESFPNGNLDVYGQWDSLLLIRVIIMSETVSSGVQCTVTLNSGSYTQHQGLDYPLPSAYKNITEVNGNNLVDTTTCFGEFGTGDGSPVNGKVSYYAIFDSDFLEMTLSNITQGYTPFYTVSGSTISYKALAFDYLTRVYSKNYMNPTYFIPLVRNSQNGNYTLENDWYDELDTDLTIIVPMVEYPIVYAQAYPSGYGTVNIDNSTPAISQKSVFPGTSCTLTATASSSSYHFVNWTKDGVVVSTNATCTITAYYTTICVANFETYPGLWYSYYDPSGVLPAGFVSHTNASGGDNVVCSSTPNVNYYAPGTVRRFRATASGLPSGCVFLGWRRYTGDTRNPSTDEVLNETSSTSTNSFYEYTTTNSDFKIYAYYDRA